MSLLLSAVNHFLDLFVAMGPGILGANCHENLCFGHRVRNIPNSIVLGLPIGVGTVLL